MSDSLQGLTKAVQRYFNLMYDSEVSRFDAVFLPTAQLHGFSAGKMTTIPAAVYRQRLAEGPSPASLQAPREEAILLVDATADTQAMVKVRMSGSTRSSMSTI